MRTGKLFLIPAFLGENNPHIIPQQVLNAVYPLNEFIVEDARSARRYLRAIGYQKNFDAEVIIHELDKHNKQQNHLLLFENMLKGKDCGLLSEAGNPCIADPGSELVMLAHRHQIEVVPLVGPSSILLALIASGFSGQRFTFHGYIPIQEPERTRAIKKMEASGQTEIFMETPFRNQKLLDEILRACQPETKLCIACDLTLSSQLIKTKKIAEWKRDIPPLHKRYCIFLLS